LFSREQRETLNLSGISASSHIGIGGLIKKLLQGFKTLQELRTQVRVLFVV